MTAAGVGAVWQRGTVARGAWASTSAPTRSPAPGARTASTRAGSRLVAQAGPRGGGRRGLARGHRGALPAPRERRRGPPAAALAAAPAARGGRPGAGSTGRRARCATSTAAPSPGSAGASRCPRAGRVPRGARWTSPGAPTSGARTSGGSSTTTRLRAQRERLVALAPRRGAAGGHGGRLPRRRSRSARCRSSGPRCSTATTSLTGESAARRARPRGRPLAPRLAVAGGRGLGARSCGSTSSTSGRPPPRAYRSRPDRAALTVSLNREMDLVVRVARREPTALDVVRGIGVVRTFAALVRLRAGPVAALAGLRGRAGRGSSAAAARSGRPRRSR